MAYTTINKGSSYFNTVLYTGNGSTLTVTGNDFKPDMTWIKARSSSPYNHVITDAVRGVTKNIYPNLTNAEDTNATDYLTSFNSNGFTVGSYGSMNANGVTFASWNWLANNTSGSTNTAGTITSTVAANTTSGFSIVSYTGTTGVATVGHGLGTAPAMIILKNRSVVSSWVVYNKSLGATRYLFLDLTLAQQTDSLAWNNTEPDSTKFTINSYTNGSGNSLIAYCFAEKKGYSKFGSFTGNGNANGTFIYTGFKPSFIMVKRTDSAGFDWAMMDNKRDTYNEIYKTLWANLTNAEYTTTGSSGMATDLLSNGFKIRGTNGENNASGGNYIYMAFAENPFVLTDGTPVTAR